MKILYLFLLFPMIEYRRPQQERLWCRRNETEIPFTAEQPLHVLQGPGFNFRTTHNLLRLITAVLVHTS